MGNPEPEFHLRVRPSEAVTVNIPVDTLAALQKVAERRNLTHKGLIKLYIGQGLRQDLTQFFSARILETAAEVLARHIDSEAEITAIIEEMRSAAVGS